MESAGSALCPHCLGWLSHADDQTTCPHCKQALKVVQVPLQTGENAAQRDPYDPALWQVAQPKPIVRTAKDASGKPLILLDSPVTLTGWSLEIRLRKWAQPLAILSAVLLHQVGLTRTLQRVVAGMMVHESGHAAVAWLSGLWAVPLPWVTRVADQRSHLLAVVESMWLIGLGFFAHKTARGGLRTAALVVLALHVPLAWLADEQAARGWVTWGGDGMGMILAALLVMAFAVPARQLLVHNGIRWGLLAIGANAWADLALPWWAALVDPDCIPYGRIEGVGASDPTRLVTTWNWLEKSMIRGYAATGALTLLAMVVAWRWGVRDAERRRLANESL